MGRSGIDAIPRLPSLLTIPDFAPRLVCVQYVLPWFTLNYLRAIIFQPKVRMKVYGSLPLSAPILSSNVV